MKMANETVREEREKTRESNVKSSVLLTSNASPVSLTKRTAENKHIACFLSE